MTWIVRQEKPNPHHCDCPKGKYNLPQGECGDLWRCDECGKLWVHDDWCSWESAGWWLRRKYRHQGWPEPDWRHLAREYDLPIVEEEAR